MSSSRFIVSLALWGLFTAIRPSLAAFANMLASMRLAATNRERIVMWDSFRLMRVGFNDNDNVIPGG